ncbi:MAG: hypothetical protein ACO1PI_06305, partial [Bacteroidota bacterium]
CQLFVRRSISAAGGGRGGCIAVAVIPNLIGNLCGGGNKLIALAQFRAFAGMTHHRAMVSCCKQVLVLLGGFPPPVSSSKGGHWGVDFFHPVFEYQLFVRGLVSFFCGLS